MERDLALCVAVVAEQLNNLVAVLLGHRRVCNLNVELVPSYCAVNDRNAAEGARGPSSLLHQRVVTGLVHRVPATEDAALDHRVEQILLADWTVLFHAVLDALVIVLQLDRVAAPGQGREEGERRGLRKCF